MNQEVYERLARHLDQLPGGFPKTESGVELRILNRLFTEEEAELACQLTHLPEPAETIAQRANRPVEELAVAGIASGLAQDLRIDVREANTADALATVRFIPAASWVWIGGTCAMLAALLLAVAVKDEASA